jgi:hypothetical protein
MTVTNVLTIFEHTGSARLFGRSTEISKIILSNIHSHRLKQRREDRRSGQAK